MGQPLKIGDIENVSALSGLFSSSTINELASQGSCKRFLSLVDESNLIAYLDADMAVREVFDLAFNLLIKRDLRVEFVYKAAIFEKIILGKNSLNTATAINELRINKSKLDIAVLNGCSIAYEIKSERDNLSKLQKQISDYCQAFPKVVIVAGENHLYKLLAVVPENIGLCILNRKYQLSEIRPAIEDNSKLNSNSICSMLRLNEGKRILELLGGKVPNLPNTLIHDAVFDELKTFDPVKLQKSTLTILKSTRGLRSKSDTVEFLPRSLKSIVTSARLTKKQLQRLQIVMDTPISSLTCLS